MQTYTDPNEDIVIGVASEEPDYIIKILEELLGYEFIENKEARGFGDIGALYQDTVVVKLGLIDEEFLMTLIENEIAILIVA